LNDVLHFYVREGMGSYNEGIFVFEEIGLDGVIRPKLWLREQCGNETQIWVQFFVDPYDPNYVKLSADVESLRGILLSEPGINARLQYIYLPTYSRMMVDARMQESGETLDEAKEYVDQAAAHMICANDEDSRKFETLERRIYSTYCNFDEDLIGTPEYASALQECEDSNHFGVPLTPEELESAKFRSGLDTVPFKGCVYTSDARITMMKDLSDGLGINRTPTVFVNCQYEVPIKWVPAAVCAINSGLTFC